MGRIYAVPFSGTIETSGGNYDLIELLPADDKPIKLRGWSIGQITEVGDAAEEGISLSVIRLPATVTSGAGGSSVTPVPMDSADAAAGFAAEVMNDSVATTSGSAATLEERGWNERASPYDFFYPDERFCPKAKQGEALVIRMATTPADNFDVYGVAWVEEE